MEVSVKCFCLYLVGSKIREEEQGRTNNHPVTASAARTSKRLREKKDRKMLDSVTADSVETKQENASLTLKQCKPGQPKSIYCCYVLVS